MASAGAVVAWWLGGHQAAWLGGAVGAVTGAFAPSVVAWAKGRLEAREALRSVSELPEGGLAALLDPRRGLVKFVGRKPELESLLAWCESDQRCGVRLVTGPGGVGKTRLSVELCDRLRSRHWRCVAVGDHAEASALQAVRRSWSGRILLVVDYAETRSGLRDLLRAVTADAGVVRILLLARSTGEWWDSLGDVEPPIRKLLAEAGTDDPLPVAVTRELSNDDLFSAAVPVFAAALGLPAPSGARLDTRSKDVRMLDLHAAALVAVLRSAGDEKPVSVTYVLDELLRHEQRFWHGTAKRLGILAGPAGMNVSTLRQIVAMGALLGAASQKEAIKLLGRVPHAPASVKVASWLRQLYPPETTQLIGDTKDWLGTLSPDRLAERLVVQELIGSRDLAERSLTGLNERQALRVVTLLGRAAVEQENAKWLLSWALDLLLEQVVSGLPADLELLVAIADAIPYPSAAADSALAINRRILDILPNGNEALRVRRLNELGLWLSKVEQPAKALEAEQEAAQILRELDAVDPGHYRADLAESLSKIGLRFAQLGRNDDALAATQEAVQVWRKLTGTSADYYLACLASSLSTLGNFFWELSRPDNALPALQEAVQMYRRLAAVNPRDYQALLVSSLQTFANWLTELGCSDDALPWHQEAVQAAQEMAAKDLTTYRETLARSLKDIGIQLSELYHPAQALPVIQEDVQAWRQPASASSGRDGELAGALSSPGDESRGLDGTIRALSATEAAVQIWRELAVKDPGSHRSELARALVQVGSLLWALDRFADALPVFQEAVQMSRELAGEDPDRYRDDLARSLCGLGEQFAKLDRPADALPVLQEGAQICRELAAEDPGSYQEMLVRALEYLITQFSKLGRAADALAATQEAVQILRELAAEDADRYQPPLARALQLLSRRFQESDRPNEGLAAIHWATPLGTAGELTQVVEADPVRSSAVYIKKFCRPSRPDYTEYGPDLPLCTTAVQVRGMSVWPTIKRSSTSTRIT